MAYPSSQNTGYPGFQTPGPPIRGQGIPPGNMMPPKPAHGMNTPGMFAPNNGQMGHVSFGNGPQPPSVQNIHHTGPPPNSMNGLPQRPIPPSSQNHTPPYNNPGPSIASQRFPGPRTGVGPPISGPPSGPVPNGPIGPRPPSTGPPNSTAYTSGPPSGAAPVGQQYRPPPMPGGIPRVAVPPQSQPAIPGLRAQGPPPVSFGSPMGDSRNNNQPPSSASSQQDSGVRPNELPVPFHGQGQYSHQIGAAMRLSAPLTPCNSEPTSRKSSRAPSPITSPTYDALEGQFTPNSQGSNPGYGTPPPSGVVPSSGSPGPAGQGPLQQEVSQRPSIIGRRVYPQSSSQPTSGQFSGPAAPSQPTSGQFSRPAAPSQPTSGQFSGPAAPQQLIGSQGQQQFNAVPGQRFGGPQAQQQHQFNAFPGQQAGMLPGQQQFRGPSGPQRFGPPGQSQFGGPPGQQFSGPIGQQQFGGPGSQSLNRPPGQQQLSGPPSQQSGALPNQQQYGGPSGQQTVSGPSQQHFGAPTGPPSGVPQGFQSGLPQSRYPPNSSQPSAGPGQAATQPGFPLPQVGQGYSNNYPGGMAAGLGQMSLQDNSRPFNLLQERQLLPPTGPEVPKPNLQHDFKNVNCSPEVFRCTLSSVPQTSSLLNKARLPLGILIHPFKDLSQLPVIQSSVIVRCRSCRTYINPFVYFVDSRRWKCNLCYRVNDIPDEFAFDPISKTYGEPQRRPEVRSSTIEFIAPSEYMLRPPQPAVYLFVLDVSFNAIETGYLSVFCETLLDELDKLPGDARTHIGFVAFDRAVHFFNLAEGLSQPQLLTVSDIEDIFLPSPDNLLVNIHESKELVIDLLNQLPTLFEDNQETGNALGAALQAAYKMMSATGGRVTVVQTCLPTAGPGALQPREDPSLRKSKDVQNIGPATDFYKKLSLECSAQQIAVDLFMLNGQYSDIGTLACISKYSSGCVYSYPSFHSMRNPTQRDRLETDLRRYFTRKIGFEAVMRIRCTKGLSIHTFHGNFFVRSTDLLSLPNINPDAGFGMQMSIEDSLTDVSTVCFQAALLYTSSKGERRIRVHTMCLPVTNQLSEVFSGADQQAIVGLLAKMAADRSVTASLNEAREAMINAALDSVTAYGNTLTASQRAGNLLSSYTLRLVPLYVLALLKSLPFRVGSVTALDDRVIALERCKTLPLSRLIQMIHPDLYPVHALNDENGVTVNETVIAQPPLLQLCSGNLDRHGAFLMDTGDNLYMLVGSAIGDQLCMDVFDKPNFMSLEDGMHDLPELDNPTSERLRLFINYLMDQRPQGVTFTILRDDSKERGLFFQHLVEDRTESTMSYYEFLQYLQKQLKA